MIVAKEEALSFSSASIPPKLLGLLSRRHHENKMKHIIKDHERGLLYRNGTLVKLINPGVYRTAFWRLDEELVRLDLTPGYIEYRPELEMVLPESLSHLVEVSAEEQAILYQHGLAKQALGPGRYFVFDEYAKASAKVYQTNVLRLDMPDEELTLLPYNAYQIVSVEQHTAALLFQDGKFLEQLKVGRHVFGLPSHRLEVKVVELRQQEKNLVGQELMTKDKVTLRLNVNLRYSVVDPVKLTLEVRSYEDLLHSEAQMCVRRQVAGVLLDELLENRKTISRTILEEFKDRALEWGIAVHACDIRDVILPGEMKLLLNQVIEAEKRAKAQVIARREETAATRSLANTAKMLEGSPVLLRLKELEAFKDLAQEITELKVITTTEQIASSVFSKNIERN